MLDEDSIRELTTTFESAIFRQLTSGPYYATDEEIEAIETGVGASLPADYRWYLRSVGRTRVHGDYSIQPDTGEDLEISTIFGGADPSTTPDTNSLEWNRRTFGDLIADEEIVIGADLFGDFFTMNLRTERFRFVQHGGGASIDLGVTGFRAFLKLLKLRPDDSMT